MAYGLWISFVLAWLLIIATFMPQFVSKNGGFLPQLIILGITYLGIGLLNDITYTLLANKVAQFLNNHSPSERFRRFRWFF